MERTRGTKRAREDSEHHPTVQCIQPRPLRKCVHAWTMRDTPVHRLRRALQAACNSGVHAAAAHCWRMLALYHAGDFYAEFHHLFMRLPPPAARTALRALESSTVQQCELMTAAQCARTALYASRMGCTDVAEKIFLHTLNVWQAHEALRIVAQCSALCGSLPALKASCRRLLVLPESLSLNKRDVMADALHIAARAAQPEALQYLLATPDAAMLCSAIEERGCSVPDAVPNLLCYAALGCGEFPARAAQCMQVVSRAPSERTFGNAFEAAQWAVQSGGRALAFTALLRYASLDSVLYNYPEELRPGDTAVPQVVQLLQLHPRPISSWCPAVQAAVEHMARMGAPGDQDLAAVFRMMPPYALPGDKQPGHPALDAACVAMRQLLQRNRRRTENLLMQRLGSENAALCCEEIMSYL